jgi:hypothetical protein
MRAGKGSGIVRGYLPFFGIIKPPYIPIRELPESLSYLSNFFTVTAQNRALHNNSLKSKNLWRN